MNKVERRQAIAHTGLITDLLWSDPQDDDGFAESPRGAGCVFGPAESNAFLEANGLDYIVRSHMLPQVEKGHENGYIVHHGGKCVTVWNAANYCGTCGNKASVGYIGDDLKIEYLVFEEVKPAETEE